MAAVLGGETTQFVQRNVQASLNSLARVCWQTSALRQKVKMKRTTVFADEDVLRRLRKIAKREQTTLSEIIRTALERYALCRRPRRSSISLVAIGQSGRSDERARLTAIDGDARASH